MKTGRDFDEKESGERRQRDFDEKAMKYIN